MTLLVTSSGSIVDGAQRNPSARLPDCQTTDGRRARPWQHARIEGPQMWGSMVTRNTTVAIEVFRTTLGGYNFPLAGVEQLKNQSYLWELRGRSTLEAIKGCSSWGLIARTAYQGESRGPRGQGLVNAKPAGHGWGSRKIGRQRSLRPCKCVLCAGASRLAKTQRFRCAQISLDGMRSLTSHGCGGAPRPCLNV